MADVTCTGSIPEQSWTFRPLPALHHCGQGQVTQMLHHTDQDMMADEKDNILPMFNPDLCKISVSENPFANS